MGYNNKKAQLSLTNPRRESMPKIAPIRLENNPSGETPSNINEVNTSMKSTFSGLQFCR